MANDKLINFKKKLVLKRITNTPKNEKLLKEENESNSNELILQSVELYEPLSWEQIQNLNKKKYRDLKIKILLNYLDAAIWNLYKAIDLYKELKNKTEYWEGKTTLDFNFQDWNTIKKVNGKITTYFKELKTIKNKIERSYKNEDQT